MTVQFLQKTLYGPISQDRSCLHNIYRRNSLRKNLICAIGMLSFLAACSGGQEPGVIPLDNSQSGTGTVHKQHRIGIILPLSGPRPADIGRRMRDAAMLALKEEPSAAQSGSGAGAAASQKDELSSRIDIFDNAGGAVQAAQRAVAAGDSIVLGPLMAGKTQQISSVLRPAGIPELSFTSDVTQAQPGVWVMGLTPESQTLRLVEAALAEGRQHIAAFLPDNALGHAFAESLMQICQSKGLDVPKILFHDHDVASIRRSFDEFSEIVARKGGDASDLTLSGTPSSSTDGTAHIAQSPVAPPPFDALLLVDTGIDLAHVIETLKADQIDPLKIRILGPTMWKSFDGKLGDLHGAWYVAPDDKQRASYVSRYKAAYHQLPSPVTDLAYDSASVAKILFEDNDFSTEALTRPQGFAGVGGSFHLLPNGHVTRNLGLYQIVPGGGAQLIFPAARDLSSVPQGSMHAILNPGQNSAPHVNAPVSAQSPTTTSPPAASTPASGAASDAAGGTDTDIMLPPGIAP